MQNPFVQKLLKWSLWFVLGLVLGAGVRRVVAADGPATVIDGKARVVLDRCIEVMGGAKRLGEITSREARGTVEIAAAGVRGEVRVQQRRDGKMLSTMDLGAAGKVVRGTDGTHAWEITPGMPAQLLQGQSRLERIERAKRLFIVPLGDSPDIASITHAGTERIEGEDFDRLEIAPVEGARRSWLFSQKTGHLVHEDSTEKGPAGDVRVRLTHTEFKTVKGVTSPMGAVQDAGGMKLVFTTDSGSLKYNPVIEDKVFAPTAEIQKLIDAAK